MNINQIHGSTIWYIGHIYPLVNSQSYDIFFILSPQNLVFSCPKILDDQARNLHNLYSSTYIWFLIDIMWPISQSHFHVSCLCSLK